MPEETNWDDIFRPSGDESPRPAPLQPVSVEPVSPQFPTARLSDPFAIAAAEATATAAAPIQRPTGPVQGPGLVPTSRRELRESGGGGRRGGGSRGPEGKRSRRWIGWLVAVTTVFALIAVGGVYAWTNYEDKIREVLGWELPNDYSGSGNGVEAIVIIQSGDIGGDVAQTLEAAKVTMTFDAVYNYLLAHPDISFQPGNYRLQERMSAEAAITALQDPANKIINSVTIPEGTTAPAAYELIASATGLTVEELQAEADKFEEFGVPAKAPSLEGYLFPATYQFDPGVTAHDALQTLVDEMYVRLDDLGVEPKDRYRVLILASIIQRESGPNVEDMYKIARVFQNRIEQGIRLESDATVAYGTGNYHTVWTTDAERQDASNKWNTYANDGLPIGPIGLPGQDALEAAINPAEGDWLFFVTVNLKTGKTVFSNNADDHQAAAEQLYAWCNASAENASYCE